MGNGWPTTNWSIKSFFYIRWQLPTCRMKTFCLLCLVCRAPT
jgi:hypothetical protein